MFDGEAEGLVDGRLAKRAVDGPKCWKGSGRQSIIWTYILPPWFLRRPGEQHRSRRLHELHRSSEWSYNGPKHFGSSQ